MKKNLLKALIFGLVFTLCPTTNLTKVVAEDNTGSISYAFSYDYLKQNKKLVDPDKDSIPSYSDLLGEYKNSLVGYNDNYNDSFIYAHGSEDDDPYTTFLTIKLHDNSKSFELSANKIGKLYFIHPDGSVVEEEDDYTISCMTTSLYDENMERKDGKIMVNSFTINSTNEPFLNVNTTGYVYLYVEISIKLNKSRPTPDYHPFLMTNYQVRETFYITDESLLIDDFASVELKSNLKFSYNTVNSTKDKDIIDDLSIFDRGWEGKYTKDDDPYYFTINNKDEYIIKTYDSIPKNISIQNGYCRIKDSLSISDNIDNFKIKFTLSDTINVVNETKTMGVYDFYVGNGEIKYAGLDFNIPENIYNTYKNVPDYQLSLKIELETTGIEETYNLKPLLLIDIEYFDEVKTYANFDNFCIQWKLESELLNNENINSYGIYVVKNNYEIEFENGCKTLPEKGKDFNSTDKSKDTLVVGINNIPIDYIETLFTVVGYIEINGHYYFSESMEIYIEELILTYLNMDEVSPETKVLLASTDRFIVDKFSYFATKTEEVTYPEDTNDEVQQNQEQGE